MYISQLRLLKLQTAVLSVLLCYKVTCSCSVAVANDDDDDDVVLLYSVIIIIIIIISSSSITAGRHINVSLRSGTRCESSQR